MENYCTQNNGDCSTCGLSNYGRDCHNNSIAIVSDGYCQCGLPVIHCDAHYTNHRYALGARLAYCRETGQSMVTPEQSAAFFGG